MYESCTINQRGRYILTLLLPLRNALPEDGQSQLPKHVGVTNLYILNGEICW